jgi:hypothetical protein
LEIAGAAHKKPFLDTPGPYSSIPSLLVVEKSLSIGGINVFFFFSFVWMLHGWRLVENMHVYPPLRLGKYLVACQIRMALALARVQIDVASYILCRFEGVIFYIEFMGCSRSKFVIKLAFFQHKFGGCRFYRFLLKRYQYLLF